MKSGFVIAAGLFDLATAVFHILFWRLFNWPESLKGSGRLNTAITQTLNIMLTYVFVVYGVSLLVQDAAASSFLLLSGAVFGAIRIGLQFYLFGVKSRASLAFVAAALFGTILHLIASFIGG